MSVFERDGIVFQFREEGRGLPFLFQHGLGGDLSQPFAVYRAPAGIRQLAFDFRAHGQTHPPGDPTSLTIATLADDLIAFLDHLAIDRAVIGGISLGSAVAVNVALRYPDRVMGLVLSRPAWLGGPVKRNVDLYAMIARLIRDLRPEAGLERFVRTREFREMESESPDCARSLIGQFEQPRAEECVARLERLSIDSPCHRGRYSEIGVPTLILANRLDPIHPWPLANTLAGLIAGAVLREITPKTVSPEAHSADVSREINEFLRTRFPERMTSC
jgi:pimeloyl-ACP methyl ester carboxylesterase